MTPLCKPGTIHSGRPPEPNGQKIGTRGNVVQIQIFQFLQLLPYLRDSLPRLLQMGTILQRSQTSFLGQGIHVERLAHTIEQFRNAPVQIPHTQGARPPIHRPWRRCGRRSGWVFRQKSESIWPILILKIFKVRPHPTPPAPFRHVPGNV